MDTISGILDWLASRESLFSALAALAAIVGIGYGVLAFIFPSFGRAVRRRFEHRELELAHGGAGGAAIPRAGSRNSAVSGPPAEVSKSSIAVLPLRTLSNNEDDEYIAAGISSEINADLAQLPDLRVASHMASLSFRGEDIDLRQVADVLSIRYVLTGSFQRHGDRMRLMAELTDAYTGEQLWAPTIASDTSPCTVNRSFRSRS